RSDGALLLSYDVLDLHIDFAPQALKTRLQRIRFRVCEFRQALQADADSLHQFRLPWAHGGPSPFHALIVCKSQRRPLCRQTQFPAARVVHCGRMWKSVPIVLSAAVSLCAQPPAAQQAANNPNRQLEYIRAHYTKYDYRIPMRDGIKLFTSVYVP